MTQESHWRVMVALLCATALTAAACSGDDQSGEQATTTPEAAAYEPVLETVPCDDELFAPPRLPEGTTAVECSTLTVPEDRAEPTGTQVVLPVAVIAASDPVPDAPPLVLLAGGPGGTGFDATLHPVATELATTRDVILLDQRGTGLATPSLDCPEVEDAFFELLGAADDPVVEKDRFMDAHVACFDRLRSEGVAVESYNTAATVADLEDLRTALGVDRWHLYGLSYGSVVVLETLATSPGSLASATIDAAWPQFATNVDPGGFVAATERGFDSVASSCAEDPACAAAHPDLESELAAGRVLLDAAPYATAAIDATGAERELLLTGEDAVWALHKGQYLTPILPSIPSFISALAGGDPTAFDLFVAQLPLLTSPAEAVYAAVTCSDRASTTPEVSLAEVRQDEPLYAATLVSEPLFPQICDLIDIRDGVGLSEVTTTTVPTLVLTSDHDPRLPPEDAEGTAQRLGGSATFIQFPGIGHVSVGAHPCPTEILDAFVSDPAIPPDTSCVEGMSGPDWVG